MEIRNLVIKLLYFVPIMIFIALVNYLGDPAGFFQSGLEAKMVAYLLRGSNIINSGNYNERLLLKYYLTMANIKPEVVVFGSSRVFSISNECFPHKRLFNSAVNRAKLEDFIAIYGIYKQNGPLPKTVIIGLDPWILNRNMKDNQWEAIGEYYSYMLSGKVNRLSQHKYTILNTLGKIYELFSISYFQKTLSFMFYKYYWGSHDNKPKIPIETLAKTGKDKMLLADGARVESLKIRNITVDEANKNAQVMIRSNNIIELEQFYDLDNEYVEQLNKFIYIIKQDKVKIVFILVPYHPFLYEHFGHTPKYSKVFAAQQQFRHIAKKNKIVLIGSYNPKEIGWNESDFLDYEHPRKNSIDKYLRKALR